MQKKIAFTEAKSLVGEDFYITLPKELADLHHPTDKKDKGRLFVRSIEVPCPDDDIDKSYDDFCKLENPDFREICSDLAYSYNELVHEYNRFVEDSEL
nr:MAG TPA: hypothetical protein [Caudoviricetes sp.]